MITPTKKKKKTFCVREYTIERGIYFSVSNERERDSDYYLSVERENRRTVCFCFFFEKQKLFIQDTYWEKSPKSVDRIMAIISATSIIRSLSIFHLTAAYFLLTSPATIADQNLVFILGAAMDLVRFLLLNPPSFFLTNQTSPARPPSRSPPPPSLFSAPFSPCPPSSTSPPPGPCLRRARRCIGPPKRPCGWLFSSPSRSMHTRSNQPGLLFWGRSLEQREWDREAGLAEGGPGGMI